MKDLPMIVCSTRWMVFVILGASGPAIGSVLAEVTAVSGL